MVTGRADSVTVNGQGVGTAYLQGAIKDAELTLSGVTNAAIDSSDSEQRWPSHYEIWEYC